MTALSMRTSGPRLGVLAALVTTVSWGGQFPVGTSAMTVLDPFWLTALRYGLAGLVLVLLLAQREGRGALRLDLEAARVGALGVVGFAGFNLLVYVGLQSTGSQSASLIVSTMPLVTAFVLWARTGSRPRAATWWASVAALAGVGLVLTDGHPGRLVHGGLGWGHLLVLVGVVCWVVYTTGARRHPGFSPLRYTAVSAAAGSSAILLITLVLTAAGTLHAPTLAAVGSVWWQLGYVSMLAGVVAVLCWNQAAQSLGPQRAVLFINVVPVTTFAITAAQGQLPTATQLLGVGVTIAALVVSALLPSGPVPAPALASAPVEEVEEVEDREPATAAMALR